MGCFWSLLIFINNTIIKFLYLSFAVLMQDLLFFLNIEEKNYWVVGNVHVHLYQQPKVFSKVFVPIYISNVSMS